jgi:NH3-dependent NAD+ synthetase
VPSDGLCGKTDEDALGFTYEQLDNYLFSNELVDDATLQKIVERHNKNLHKECIQIPGYKAIIKDSINLEDNIITVET